MATFRALVIKDEDAVMPTRRKRSPPRLLLFLNSSALSFPTENLPGPDSGVAKSSSHSPLFMNVRVAKRAFLGRVTVQNAAYPIRCLNSTDKAFILVALYKAVRMSPDIRLERCDLCHGGPSN